MSAETLPCDPVLRHGWDDMICCGKGWSNLCRGKDTVVFVYAQMFFGFSLERHRMVSGRTEENTIPTDRRIGQKAIRGV